MGTLDLFVNGFSGALDALNGVYVAEPGSLNHDRPLFRKRGGFKDGESEALVYYFDERDGPDFAGWWFAPDLSGEKVWARNPKLGDPQPPKDGWLAPWDSKMPDGRIRMNVKQGQGSYDSNGYGRNLFLRETSS